MANSGFQKFWLSCACSLPVPVKYVPQSVSIISSDDFEASVASNQLPVLNAKDGTGTYDVNSTDVGVCVKPMHFHYNKSMELIEFIELNKILGVTKFTLYNDTVSNEVNCILNHYIRKILHTTSLILEIGLLGNQIK